ncbi:hypothetical protein ACFRAO_42775 [Streptomyces sp. NPDC056656]|uniref:hypothetical protein n=1 Tax=Streptomyces sp. NPDC056656 TaxID=3345895 RepID=UPI0036B915E8
MVPLAALCRPQAPRSGRHLAQLAQRVETMDVPLVTSGMLLAELRSARIPGSIEPEVEACRHSLADVLTAVREGGIEGVSFDLSPVIQRLISQDPHLPFRFYHPSLGRWLGHGRQDQAAVLRSIWGHLLRRTSPQQSVSSYQSAGCPAATRERGRSHVSHA